MPLWNKNGEPTSMPKWYARNTFFKPKAISDDGKLSLRNSSTQFKTGDCVIYLSNNPVAPLESKGVYYLHRGKNFMYTFHNSRDEAIKNTGKIELVKSDSEENHLLIKYDTKETSKDATECPALYPVDVELAKKRIGGLVSPGWWRIYRYQDSDKKERVKLELLAVVKKMVVDGGETPELPEEIQTPIVTITPLTEEWKCNTPCEFTIAIDPKNAVGKHMKAKLLNFDPNSFERISRFKNNVWQDLTDAIRKTGGAWPNEILIEAKEQKFQILFPFKEGQPSPIKFAVTLEVSQGSDVEFKSTTVKFEKDVVNEVTKSTVDHVSVDEAIVA